MITMKLPLNEFQRMILRYALFVICRSFFENSSTFSSIIGELTDDEAHALKDIYQDLMVEEKKE